MNTVMVVEYLCSVRNKETGEILVEEEPRQYQITTTDDDAGRSLNRILTQGYRWYTREINTRGNLSKYPWLKERKHECVCRLSGDITQYQEQ